MMRKTTMILAALLAALMLLSACEGVGTAAKTRTEAPEETARTTIATTPETKAPSTEETGTQASSPANETPTPDTTEETTTPEPPFDPLAFYDYQYEFKSDLSAYEQYMNVRGEDYLILVNPSHPLKSTYEPEDLVTVESTRKGREKTKLRLYAAKALEALYIEADANGMLFENRAKGSDGRSHKNVLSVTTAYRSYKTQKSLYNSYVERDAKLYPEKTLEEVKALVATYSCPPGTSEHQTGLCVDMHNWPTAGRYMADEFAASPVGVWLAENCYKFGFILRFEKAKTDITGITFESWHYRYVGRFHATRMHELNMCLEEYVEYLAEFGYTINGGFDGMAE